MQILKILKSKTLTQSFVTFSGTAVNGVLGILFYIFVARELGPENFGILMISIASITMISDIADLGTDTGLIRFVGKYINTSRDDALRFMKLGLQIKLLVGSVIVFSGWFLVPSIAAGFFDKQELVLPLRLSLFGVFGALLFSFTTHSIQALQKFTTWSILNISLNALRITVILLFAFQGVLSLEGTLLTYIVMPVFGFLTGFMFLPKFWLVDSESKVVKEFFHYNKWVAIFTIMAAISSRLDIFITGKLLSLKDVGIYSAANQVTAVIPQLIFALATVVAPKLASFSSNIQAKQYLTKLQLFISGLVILGLLILPIGVFLFPILFGEGYTESIVPLIILFIAQLVFLFSLPAHQAVFYYFGYPRLFVWISLGHLLIVAMLGWYLISVYGVVGAALTVLVGNIFNFIVPSVWVIKKLGEDKK